MTLLEDSNDDSEDTTMDTDASRCLWALYYGRCPNLITLGCIHLPVSLNCAWGVLSEGPYRAADVVNLLKTGVPKGDTDEDVEWRSVMQWASTGQPFQQQEHPDEGGDTDSSEEEIEEVTGPQTPKPKGKTNKQRQKEQEKAECELQKQEEVRERQRKREEKEKEKKAKEDERANRNRKEEEDKQATVAVAASPSQKNTHSPAVAGYLGTSREGWTAQEWWQDQRQVSGTPTYHKWHGCHRTITDI